MACLLGLMAQNCLAQINEDSLTLARNLALKSRSENGAFIPQHKVDSNYYYNLFTIDSFENNLILSLDSLIREDYLTDQDIVQISTILKEMNNNEAWKLLLASLSSHSRTRRKSPFEVRDNGIEYPFRKQIQKWNLSDRHNLVKYIIFSDYLKHDVMNESELFFIAQLIGFTRPYRDILYLDENLIVEDKIKNILKLRAIIKEEWGYPPENRD